MGGQRSTTMQKPLGEGDKQFMRIETQEKKLALCGGFSVMNIVILVHASVLCAQSWPLARVGGAVTGRGINYQVDTLGAGEYQEKAPLDPASWA